MTKAVLLLVLAALFSIVAAGCLDFSQDVSSRFPELEARAGLEREVRKLCDHRKARVDAILEAIDAAEAISEKDNSVFQVDAQEVLMFPSGVATGSYISTIKNELCR